MAAIDVVIVQDKTGPSGALEKSTHPLSQSAYASSLKNMVNTLVKLCEDSDRIRELRIVGHGNEQGQMIGSDFVTIKTLPRFRPELARMNRLFIRDPRLADDAARVIMGGCHQGRNMRLLLALSNIWNVPVSGFSARQWPFPFVGDEGGRSTCYITCTRQGYTLADSMDEFSEKARKWYRGL